MRNILKKAMALLMVSCLLMACACAETVRGDLSKRFEDVVHLEYEGTTYRLRDRLTTVLAMAVAKDAQGTQKADFARILVVDDNQKIMSMVDIPANALIQVPSEMENETWNMRFADAYTLGEDPDAACLILQQAVNNLLGYELVENYIAFDLEGTAVLNGGQAVPGDAKEQLQVLKARLEEMSTEEMNDTYALLGDYIITDMKSGAVMKIMDKSERYERRETLAFPGAEADAGQYGKVMVSEEDMLTQLLLSLFFEEGLW